MDEWEPEIPEPLRGRFSLETFELVQHSQSNPYVVVNLQKDSHEYTGLHERFFGFIDKWDVNISKESRTLFRIDVLGLVRYAQHNPGAIVQLVRAKEPRV